MPKFEIELRGTANATSVQVVEAATAEEARTKVNWTDLSWDFGGVEGPYMGHIRELPMIKAGDMVRDKNLNLVGRLHLIRDDGSCRVCYSNQVLDYADASDLEPARPQTFTVAVRSMIPLEALVEVTAYTAEEAERKASAQTEVEPLTWYHPGQPFEIIIPPDDINNIIHAKVRS